MTETPRRTTSPRRWTTLAAAGTAATLAQALPVHAQMDPGAQMPAAQIWLAQATAEGGEGGEGGESGEGGAIADATPELSYLARLRLVEGHLKAAVMLYSKGLVDDAVGLAGHPEAEMMDEVREGLAAHGARDFTPELEAVGEVMADGAPQADVDAAMDRLSAAITQASDAASDTTPRTRFDLIEALVRAAAEEYSGSLENGTVADLLAYHEAFGFIGIARGLAEPMTADGDPAVEKAANKVLTALEKTGAAFGEISRTTAYAGDPSLLYSAAAQVEIAALSVK